MSTDATTPRPAPRSGKRQAILDGALTLFARDGYTRASLDGIAAAAGVSVRTIYNHFPDKAQLFLAVILDGSRRVADVQIDVIDRHLRKIVDLEADLVDFGLDWLAVLDSDLALHFALVRQINAEAEHIPADAYRAWQEAGPLRVRRHLADRLRRVAALGHLQTADPERAALHLTLLLSVGGLTRSCDFGTPAERRATVEAGVHAFLHGYAA
ncbi:TetR/AcrR family transcriptional regulator [Kitasatospora sp. NPDC086801]|uniref:TetR/AcrR family transcriptional regulator n=1 Tax=Kitasatospora sp. NPDC086801 TaxID=3364066 RepID=UPI00380611CA